MGGRRAERGQAHAVAAPHGRAEIACRKSVGRDPEKSAQDWQDNRKIVQLHKLDPADYAFAGLILHYGGEEALERIRRMCDN